MTLPAIYINISKSSGSDLVKPHILRISIYIYAYL